jgi:methylthioribose-1-phosphate isomerase
VVIVDQTLLPERLEFVELHTVEEVGDAIARLAVRGAPAIGVCAAMGLAAALGTERGSSREHLLECARRGAQLIRDRRPTAVNLGWALDRVLARATETPGDAPAVLRAMRQEAECIREEDREMCRRIGEYALQLLPVRARVLTHCNAGALATSGIGTALAPVYMAAAEGREVSVMVGETRPLFQGSRLTAWELTRAGVPVTVITDSMAPMLMRDGRVDLCIVGADRIAANGDTANKIGTYALAVAARHHQIPFYVAAPSSTFDRSLAGGGDIQIEQRARSEIAGGSGRVTVPEGATVENPAFDVTPADLITAIITEAGVHYPPFDFRSS